MDLEHDCCTDNQYLAEMDLVEPGVRGSIYLPGSRTIASAADNTATTCPASTPKCQAMAIGVGLGVPLGMCLLTLGVLVGHIFNRRAATQSANTVVHHDPNSPPGADKISSSPSAKVRSISTMLSPSNVHSHQSDISQRHSPIFESAGGLVVEMSSQTNRTELEGGK
ncbi:hypothetical protein MKZ38_005597 [Zalerion maritima]|uniref:Uncharacterized protein n=1 Tax=Zalerion maritima TaxID=339359 RepID=A0AAD5RQJ9_9PEZI|nr:hypothetical protein MKZ38_005597 [Zalerion maritima]